MKNDLTVLSKNVNLSDAIKAMLNRSCIIDFGIVKEVIKNGDNFTGIVRVAMSVATSQADVRIVTCVLVTPTSTALAMNIIPEEGDKVLVVYPRRFDASMFSKSNDDIIMNESANGYSPFTAMAILCNQFRPSDYDNYIKAEGKDITVKQNDVQIDIKEDNSVTIDTSKAKVEIDSNGNVTVDAQNGKLSLKNTAGGSLFNLLNGMLTILNSSLTTAGSPASHTVVPGQFTQQITDLTNLMQ